ncbi:histidine triad nucleotide-binding protein [Halobacteriovorax sp. HLS]|uniref:histidine triad nucleotide-binding protein n=1 Tax=Halobacteriovorax sp. HLS TaxID=2234000 RepID=UPI000FDBE914|nr:histidine triad nucleotide-binding protein [Halobacteriovorax sp. HLS]
MSNCIFCKIVAGEIPSTKVYEDEKVLGFKDLNPMAEVHNLFIHKDHTQDLNDLSDNKQDQLGDIFSAISKYSKESKLAEDGFRVVTNIGNNGGQTVFHTHFHVLGGQRLGGFGS